MKPLRPCPDRANCFVPPAEAYRVPLDHDRALRKADVELKKRSVENDLFWLLANIDSREEAIAFVQRVNGPLRGIQKRFDLPSGKVVKVS